MENKIDKYKTKIYRSIVEKSSMINNDEFVSYGDKKDFFRDKNGTLSLSRPVFQIEIDEGLNISSKEISTYQEKVPSITKLIDGIYELKKIKDFFELLEKDVNPTIIAKDYLGMHFYDCMSGGANSYILWLIKYLCDNNFIEMKTDIYPTDNEKGFYDFYDFCKETERWGENDLKKIIEEYNGREEINLLIGEIR